MFWVKGVGGEQNQLLYIDGGSRRLIADFTSYKLNLLGSKPKKNEQVTIPVWRLIVERTLRSETKNLGYMAMQGYKAQINCKAQKQFC